MKPKQKLLKIEQVLIDKETYPRLSRDFVTTARYINALKSGDIFPPIEVAKLDGKYYLIDGAHRLEANRANGETHITVDVFEDDTLDKKEIYKMAVQRNITHGRQFSTQEVTNICITLGDWNLSDEEISVIVRLPAEQIKPFVAKRMMRISETNEGVALKSTLKHLAGTEVENITDQNQFGGTSQIRLLDTLILLLNNGWLDLNSNQVQSKIQKLYNLLKTMNLK